MNPDHISTYLRRSAPRHDIYTVRFFDRGVAATVTAHPGTARRWLHTTRWIHRRHLHSGGLVAGLGVQCTVPLRALLNGPPEPATVQICVGRRCLVFQIQHADAVPEALRRFLADRRITFVGSGFHSDCRKLRVHYGLHVAVGRELRSMAGMGNASMERMADRFLGYAGVKKLKKVSMSAWHARELTSEQVQYACVDAYLAFRLGLRLGANRRGGRSSKNRGVSRVNAQRIPPYTSLLAAASEGLSDDSWTDDSSEYEGGEMYRLQRSPDRVYLNIYNESIPECVGSYYTSAFIGEGVRSQSVDDLSAEFEHTLIIKEEEDGGLSSDSDFYFVEI